MAVVLDSSAIIVMGFDLPGSSEVEKMLEDEHCYISPVSVAEAYCTIKSSNSARAYLILEMMMNHANGIEMVPVLDSQLISAAGDAMRAEVSTGICFAVALANKFGVPLVGRGEDIELVQKARICRVRKV